MRRAAPPRWASALALTLALGALGAGCRGRQGPPVTRLELRRAHHVHTVQAGESAWAIAKRYGVSLDDLVALNELEDPSRLYPGDQLLIPGPKAAAASAAAPPPPPPPPPTPPALTGEPRPSTRTCAEVKTWLAPPEDVSERGYSWPVDGVVITKYGKQDGLPHEGLDIAAPVGTPVRAAAAGEVVFAGEQGGFGNLVLVRDEGGLVAVYAHHHVNCVEAKQKVARGELIGLVGQTGGARSPYLYFEVREGKETLNPRIVLPR